MFRGRFIWGAVVVGGAAEVGIGGRTGTPNPSRLEEGELLLQREIIIITE